MQLFTWADPGRIDRNLLVQLFQDLTALQISCAVELTIAPLGREPQLLLAVPRSLPLRLLHHHFTFIEPTDRDANPFNPQGVHLAGCLKPRTTMPLAALETAPLLVELPTLVEAGEGASLQYHLRPDQHHFIASLRAVASAANYQRAGELLSALCQPLRKQFRLVLPTSAGLHFNRYSFREAEAAGGGLRLTPLQLSNLLPVVKAVDPLVAELKTLVRGQVLADEESLNHYATDGSIFRLEPWAVVLPQDANDIRAVVQWVGRKKEAAGADDKKFSITCRGKATDQAGGPLNDGIIIRFPNCLDKILEVGPDFIRVEPGAIWSTVNEALAPQGRFVPCYPASSGFATIGGGVANNCSGEKTVKYGSMRDYIRAVTMILDDGETAVFKLLTTDEVTAKQALANREGEIYRQVNDLVIGNYNLIENSRLKVNKSATGYWLHDVLTETSLDLTKLICGSQGTLGIITEITLKTLPKPPLTGLLLASFDDLEKAGAVISDLLQLRPSALEMVDRFLIEMVQREKPRLVAELMNGRTAAPAIVLLIEFDGDQQETIKEKIMLAKTKLGAAANDLRETYDTQQQDKLWQVRRSAAIVAEGAQRKKKALPFIEDVTVHPTHLSSYLRYLYGILQQHGVAFSVWGHAGNGNIHVQPFLDLGDPADREKLFAIAEETYRKVIELRGALSGEHNDGLMRSPFLKDEVGEEMYQLFAAVKKIFDPRHIFNPRKKIGGDLNFIKQHLRNDYVIHFGPGAATT